ncbi:hypothetical protein [Streptomyces sp. NWU339]|nr:hypothetical protein [Streptomyces sp. NWU339]
MTSRGSGPRSSWESTVHRESVTFGMRPHPGPAPAGRQDPDRLDQVLQ